MAPSKKKKAQAPSQQNVESKDTAPTASASASASHQEDEVQCTAEPEPTPLVNLTDNPSRVDRFLSMDYDHQRLANAMTAVALDTNRARQAAKQTEAEPAASVVNQRPKLTPQSRGASKGPILASGSGAPKPQEPPMPHFCSSHHRLYHHHCCKVASAADKHASPASPPGLADIVKKMRPSLAAHLPGKSPVEIFVNLAYEQMEQSAESFDAATKMNEARREKELKEIRRSYDKERALSDKHFKKQEAMVKEFHTVVAGLIKQAIENPKATFGAEQARRRFRHLPRWTKRS
ncbi:hypothetical protein FH972_022661 [Carpinus fangiana]|uniref:Uncharacterized protein n=1 Tax=Carpinus fangiana TaxID=176857 RepID=A0A5N6KSW7_9ROSI|nr:hypothetical protein FH972_022661 [Carpinus fangiana]